MTLSAHAAREGRGLTALQKEKADRLLKKKIDSKNSKLNIMPINKIKIKKPSQDDNVMITSKVEFYPELLKKVDYDIKLKIKNVDQ